MNDFQGPRLLLLLLCEPHRVQGCQWSQVLFFSGPLRMFRLERGEHCHRRTQWTERIRLSLSWWLTLCEDSGVLPL